MKRILLITILVTAFGAMSATAQTNYFSFQYSMGMGTGDLADFTKKFSFRGAQVEWRRFIDPTVSVGVDVGWNTFYEQKAIETYTRGTASLTGKQYRYQNSFPMLAVGNYYLNPGEKLRPFFGLGLGTMYSVRDTQMYVYSLEQDAWHFAMCPQVGMLYEVGFSTSLYLGLKYNVGFTSGDFDAVQSYLAINVGFAFGE